MLIIVHRSIDVTIEKTMDLFVAGAYTTDAHKNTLQAIRALTAKG